MNIVQAATFIRPTKLSVGSGQTATLTDPNAVLFSIADIPMTLGQVAFVQCVITGTKGGVDGRVEISLSDSGTALPSWFTTGQNILPVNRIPTVTAGDQVRMTLAAMFAAGASGLATINFNGLSVGSDVAVGNSSGQMSIYLFP